MALRKASRVLTGIYDDFLKPHNITITQFSLLRNIARQGEVTLSHLADLMVMDRTTLYRTIAPVEREGLVTIAAAARGNVRQAKLTKAGKSLLAKAEKDWLRAEDEIEQRLGRSTLTSIHALSADIIKLSQV
ncbi:MarR family winged helix-turn-helix transcriptional regulator [Aestuariivirga litoralis]|uniref:MarR family winged helix-turn-helix transcriptional regulator n=1 Tax=Aestuariivirga litoralis TaxID=2650924 RepID=UPI0018C5550E|nr:MarR family transcriptional regulator [Aestuariivirga litoralis]